MEKPAESLRPGEPSPQGGSSGGGQSELAKTFEVLRSNPVVKALMGGIGGFAFVLDAEQRIVMSSSEVPERLREEDADGLLGGKIGELFGCLNAPRSEGGCGQSKPCSACGAFAAISKSLRQKETVRTVYRVTTSNGKRELTRKFDLVASGFSIGPKPYSAVFLKEAGVFERNLRPLGTFSMKTGDLEGAKFEKLSILGEGGMSRVYLVRDGEGREYALKVLRKDLLKEGESTERFRRELDLSLEMDHPNVVHTFHVGQTRKGYVFLLCEYCPEGDLFGYYKRFGLLPMHLALRWMIETARGLDYLWTKHQVLHRDIKPDNLLLSSEGRVKISDFGIARLKNTGPRLTTPGFFIGSPAYASPEQQRGDRDLDIRSDLFSLGATFYHLLTGMEAVEHTEDLQGGLVLKRVLPEPLLNLRPDLPAEFSGLIEAQLSPERESRSQSPLALLEALNSVAERLDQNPEAKLLSLQNCDTREMPQQQRPEH